MRARFAELTASGGDSGARCVALRMLALERFHEGQYEPSLQLLEEALSVYDPVAHRELGLRYGHDPRTGAMNYKAWNLWYLGFQDQARATAEQALKWAREVGHQNTIGIALCLGVTMTSIWSRDVSRVEASTAESLRLAKDKSLLLWKAFGRIHFGWALAERGHPDALAEIEAGLDEARRIRAGRYEAFHLGLAADARSRAGQHDAAQAMIAAAFAAQARSQDMPFLPDLHRLQGRNRASRRGRCDRCGRSRSQPGAHNSPKPGGAVIGAAGSARPRATVGRARRAAARPGSSCADLSLGSQKDLQTRTSRKPSFFWTTCDRSSPGGMIASSKSASDARSRHSEHTRAMTASGPVGDVDVASLDVCYRVLNAKSLPVRFRPTQDIRQVVPKCRQLAPKRR